MKIRRFNIPLKLKYGIIYKQNTCVIQDFDNLILVINLQSLKNIKQTWSHILTLDQYLQEWIFGINFRLYRDTKEAKYIGLGSGKNSFHLSVKN